MDLLVLVWPPLQTAVSSSSRMSGANRRTAVTRGSMVAARRDALRPDSRQSRLISRADNRDDWPRCAVRARWLRVVVPANNRKHLRAFGPPGDARALNVKFVLISLMAGCGCSGSTGRRTGSSPAVAPRLPHVCTCQDHLRGASGRRVVESAGCATGRVPNAVSARASCCPVTAAPVAAPLRQLRCGGRGSLSTRSTANAIVGNRL